MSKEANFSNADATFNEELNDGKEGLRILAKIIARIIINKRTESSKAKHD